MTGSRLAWSAFTIASLALAACSGGKTSVTNIIPSGPTPTPTPTPSSGPSSAPTAQPLGTLTEFGASQLVGAGVNDIVGLNGFVYFTACGGESGSGTQGFIGQMSTSGVIQTKYVAGISAGACPNEMTTSLDGSRLWFTEYGDGYVGQLNLSSGTTTEYPVAIPTGQPPSFHGAGIITEPNGDMWYADQCFSACTQDFAAALDTNGNTQRFFLTGSKGGYDGLLYSSVPSTINGGFIFIADTEGNRIDVVSADQNSAATPSPVPAAIGSLGTAIINGVTSQFDVVGSGQIDQMTAAESFTPLLATITPVLGTSPSLYSTRTMVIGPDNALWFTEYASGSSGKIGRLAQGQLSEYPVNGIPRSIAVGPDSNIWFTERGGVEAIGRIATGFATTTAVRRSTTTR